MGLIVSFSNEMVCSDFSCLAINKHCLQYLTYLHLHNIVADWRYLDSEINGLTVVLYSNGFTVLICGPV